MFDAALWNSTTTEGFADSTPPPPGQYVISIAEGKYCLTGENKDKPTIVVSYRDQDGKTWDDVKQLTTEGRIKSAKILMRDLRLDVDSIITPEQIHAALKSVEGKFFAVEVKQSSTMKADGSGYYLNTTIVGPWEGQPQTFAQPPAAPPQSDIPNGLPPAPVQQPVPAQAPQPVGALPEGWS